MHPDEAYESLAEIYNQFADFCKMRGLVSETDTRVKIIDRIIKEVLGWPECAIIREESIQNGFIDYTLTSSKNRRLIVVEAKRESNSFEIPIDKYSNKYKLNGSIKSNKPLYDAIEQVQRYCNENATRYAIVTNGYAWVVFRAFREDIPWRDGYAIVFSSAGEIKKRFNEFWNLLSYNQVITGSLDSSFSNIHYISRKLHRVVDELYNNNRLLIRNRFHTQLSPIIDQIFGDIADQGQIEILEKCYIHSRTLSVMDEDLKRIIDDAIPNFALNDGTIDTTPGKFDGGNFGKEISCSVKDPDGSVFLLLGGIGSGKSTFIKRFFNHVGAEFMKDAGFWFYITFLTPPNIDKLEEYVFEEILKQIRGRYSFDKLEEQDNLLNAFAEDILALNRTILFKETEDEYQRRISKYMQQWVQNNKKYIIAMLNFVRQKNKTVVICIDNVDQLSPEYQREIFFLAQRISKELKSITVVALREESFYAASIRKTFTAYNIKRFHIASPCFRTLIGTRLNYACQILKRPDQDLRLILKSGVSIDKVAINNFFEIIRESLFARNRNIVRFIECISFGNMREALDMFARFLYSGNTDVNKMLNIFSAQKRYYVGFHEFAKSVILGDKYYYRESESKVLNIFNCGAELNSSHFTSLRLLNYLLEFKDVSSPEGQGFIEISRVLNAFVNIFDNEDDFILSADRLLRKYLIETDTRNVETIRFSNYFRVTASGWYYFNYLSRSFAYLDLVFIDTPINSDAVHKSLIEYVEKVDGISDNNTQNRIDKTELRFSRVNEFIKYLQKEELLEREKFYLDKLDNPLSIKIVEPINNQLSREIQTIRNKISQNNYFDIDEVEINDYPFDYQT